MQFSEAGPGQTLCRWFWTEAEGGGLKFLLLLLSEKHLYFFPRKLSQKYSNLSDLTYSFIFFKSIFVISTPFHPKFYFCFFSLHYICPLYYLDRFLHKKNQLKDVHVMYCFSIFNFFCFFSDLFLPHVYLGFLFSCISKVFNEYFACLNFSGFNIKITLKTKDFE